MAKTIDLNEQANQIMKMAEESGVQSNFLFVTTFERYLTQLDMLKKYKAIMKEDGIIVSKEYVKGRQNVYSSPAATEYNRTTDSANKTAATLMRILKTFNVAENDADEDPLMRAINGGDEE